MTTNSPNGLVTGRPVASLTIQFQWHDGVWKDLFDKHIRFVQQDQLRALAAGKLLVYLSCPISTRAGGYSATNVEIADFTVERLSAEWGTRFWFLNPAQYQMESAQGLGLIRMHAYELGLEQKKPIDVDQLMKLQPPVGGDYMRMWTIVLAEDGAKNLGDRFSAFYFLSPSDVKAFFMHGGAKDVTSAVELYFARKFQIDSDFQKYFSLPLIEPDGSLSAIPAAQQPAALEKRKHDFFQFYAVKASAYFSKGSHDEWNILQELNGLRSTDSAFGMGYQIASYFEGLQVSPGSTETHISPGYAVSPGDGSPIARPTELRQIARSTPAIDRLARDGK